MRTLGCIGPSSTAPAAAPRVAVRRGWKLVALLALLWAPAVVAQELIELQPSARQQLRSLRTAWQNWTEAYLADDPSTADTALAQMEAICGHLGMSHLPDLSIAIAGYAVQSAQDGNVARARWVLDDSRQLDPGRPETDFALASIQRLDGDYIGAALAGIRGYGNLLSLPLERSVWLHNVGIWLIYLLLASSIYFLALQMATKGRKLYYDLSRMLSPPLPAGISDLLVIVVLLWPLALPAGPLWLALYWSVLLWGYGSTSEKTVFVVLWALFGTIPLALSYQQLSIQLKLIPPSRALDNLQSERLYGGLFSDIGLLQTLLPDDPSVREVSADLHRRLGQWDEARSVYNSIAENPELRAQQVAPALSNLGLYHLRRKEYDTAVAYFQRATEANPDSAAAYFNLSQAYSQLYDFDRSNDTLRQAQQLDNASVEVWSSQQLTPEESGVEVDGGLRQVESIQLALRSLWRSEESTEWVDVWRRHFSISVVLATLLLAVTLHRVRLQMGYRSSLLETSENELAENPWVRAVVPGWGSAIQERGGRAFFGILLPMAFLLLPLLQGVGYREPLGYDPGHWLPTVTSLAFLSVWLLARIGWELSSER